MCGFLVSKSPFFNFQKALNLAEYRGPDYQGSVTYDDIKIGHNRLSIIDLNERSNQPFIIDNFSLVYNGEIYNYKEIREDLELNHKIEFNTSGDTEVLLQSYIVWGKDCLKKFNGMFSFVIFDKKNNKIFSAVDRLGVKPCYYKINHEEIIFGSESYGMSTKLSSKSIESFLTYGYNSPPHTIYEDVMRLSPGTYIEVDTTNHDIILIDKYWDTSSDFSEKYKNKSLEKLLKDSIKLRLESDVEIAALLSGGVDSSLLASILKDQKVKIKYYTIGVPNSELDESKRAKKIASHLNLEHSIYYLNEDDVKKMLNIYCESMDEPLGDSSILPTMFVFKKISEKYKVVLSADGGDEMAMGYPKYFGIKKNISRRKIINLIPFSFMKKIIHKILKIIFKGRMRYDLYLEALFLNNIDTEEQMLKHLSRKISQEKAYKIFPNKNSSLNYKLQNDIYQNNQSIQTKSDINNYLSGDILRKVDKASMIFSVESREPFLDYRLFELMLTYPEKKKFNNKKMKIPLRNLLEKFIDKSIWEHKKTGFSVPIENWLRGWLHNDLNKHIDQLSKLNFINKSEVNKLKKKFIDGDNSDTDLFWNIFILGIFIEKNY